MLRLGIRKDTGEGVYLSDEARRQGVYTIGTTGTGKTTFLIQLILQDIGNPETPSVIVLDPHGDMIDEILLRIPPQRANDVILFAPGERNEQYEFPLGLNILSCNIQDAQEKELVSSTVIGTLRKLYFYSWGPRMEELLRNGVLTVLQFANTTLLDLWLLLASQRHREQYYTAFGRLSDPFLRKFWWTYFQSFSKAEQADVVASSLNKIGRFLGNPIIRHVVCQPNNAFDLSDIMDHGKILLVNLSKGDLGEDNSALFGAVLINLILIAALRRRVTPPDKRRLVHLYVDEYQSFATESFPTLQSEARKYGITVTVAHQYRDQLDTLNRGSTMNVANLITFRVSGIDAPELARQFNNTPPDPDLVYEPFRRPSLEHQGYFIPDKGLEVQQPGIRRMFSDVAEERANELTRLPNYTAQARIFVGRDPQEYTLVADPLPRAGRSLKVANIIRENSRKLGQSRTFVAAAIEKQLDQFPLFTDDEIPPP